MNEINEQLKGISELVTRIDAKVLEITTKLDELIKALHEYDDENIQHCEYSELPSVKAYYEDKIISWDVDGAERRMDIIGQNGNEGFHYDSHHVTNEEADEDANKFNDYEMRVGKDNDTQDKHVVGDKNKHVDKKKNKRK